MSCRIKVFDLLCGDVSFLEEHMEEVWQLLPLRVLGSWVLLSASFDGYIVKWRMNDDFRFDVHRFSLTLITFSVAFSSSTSHVLLKDPDTVSVYDIALVPNCGNKYVMAACDRHVSMFDIEEERV